MRIGERIRGLRKANGMSQVALAKAVGMAQSSLSERMESGSGEISGQALLRQAGGGVVTCAGNQVFAMPATDYTREIIGIMKQGKIPAGPGGSSAAPPPRMETVCDSLGGFSFSGMSAGGWIVVTEVSWLVGRSKQGGSLVQHVDLRDNEKQKISLTGANLMP